MFGFPEIAVSMAGLVCPGRDDARSRIDTIATLGVRGIVLDATLRGLRARELTHSAHRDIAATLRRAELEPVGIDLWIPPEDFASPQHATRAFDATRGAMGLASSLRGLAAGASQSRPVVSVMLPIDLGEQMRDALREFAEYNGCALADHRVLGDDESPAPGMGVGIDPVMYLHAERSPAKAVTRAGDRLRSARLCDTDGTGRCELGAAGGKLDLTAYLGALAVANQEWVTLDVRKLHDPPASAVHAIHRWRDAGTL